MMQSRILKIGMAALALLMIAAAFLGVEPGTDFTDGYLIRISSAEPFAFETVSERIFEEFSGKLGDMHIQHGAENYNDQLVIRVQEATEEDAACMVEIAAENQAGAYLRSFDAVANPYGMGKFWNYTVLLLVVCVVSAAFLWYRHGLGGGLAALAGGLGALLCTVSLLGIAGVALNEGVYLASGLLSLSYVLLGMYLLNEGAGIKVALLAGESVDAIAHKSWAESAGKAILPTAAGVLFALLGCILAGTALRAYMLAILLGVVGAAFGAGCLGFPIYLLFSQKHLLKSASKKKTKAIK